MTDRIRFPVVRPELPPIKAWTPILEEAYRANWFTNFGALSRRLETELVSLHGGANAICVATSSGTAALAAPLIAHGVTGHVLIPAFTFPATAWAVRMAGAEPLLMDVSHNDWRVSADAFETALAASSARAAILAAPFGLRTEFREHAEIAAKHGALLIIDNAAGLGGGRSTTGNLPHVFEIFSLHATKPFGIGEGGAIFASPAQESGLRGAINFGLPEMERTTPAAWGLNGKLSEIHAAIGLAVAQTFEARIEKRRAMAGDYIVALSSFPNLSFPRSAEEGSWQLFPMLLPSASAVEAFAAAARADGLETRRYYRPALSRLNGVARIHQCSASEDLSERMVCVPVYSTNCGERGEVIDLTIKSLKATLD